MKEGGAEFTRIDNTSKNTDFVTGRLLLPFTVVCEFQIVARSHEWTRCGATCVPTVYTG